ncbi:hypothetical protein CSHISOI_03405 [Colletotrichum shisoi]|uniref:Uncharacterized protein n=1 Tax=Colletotrichum shisoi TaxID=2078593 RepID=A0A5Q4C0N2_9PEZI|nr:hypothetical protein CSHISOI_03405 [Colletotrichum shisoi]
MKSRTRSANGSHEGERLSQQNKRDMSSDGRGVGGRRRRETTICGRQPPKHLSRQAEEQGRASFLVLIRRQAALFILICEPSPLRFRSAADTAGFFFFCPTDGARPNAVACF